MATCKNEEPACSTETGNEVFDKWSDEESYDGASNHSIVDLCGAEQPPIKIADLRDDLVKLFPHHKEFHIDAALGSCTLLKEAANNLLENDFDVDDEKWNIDTFALVKILLERIKPNATSSSDWSCKDLPNLQFFLEEFKTLQSRIKIEEIKVDRQSIWADILKFYKQKLASDGQDLGKTFVVTFEDEDGLDRGAVKVEFFNMAWENALKRLIEESITRLVPI